MSKKLPNKTYVGREVTSLSGTVANNLRVAASNHNINSVEKNTSTGKVLYLPPSVFTDPGIGLTETDVTDVLRENTFRKGLRLKVEAIEYVPVGRKRKHLDDEAKSQPGNAILYAILDEKSEDMLHDEISYLRDELGVGYSDAAQANAGRVEIAHLVGNRDLIFSRRAESAFLDAASQLIRNGITVGDLGMR